MSARGDLNGWWRAGVVVVGGLARAMFRIRVSGIDHVPRTGPGVVAANHLSVLDGILLAVVIARHRRRMTRFLTAAEFFDKRAFGWALRLYRMIPLRRGEGDAGALDEAIRTIGEGALAGIFPEGLVNPAPERGLQRGRTGAARIALATRAPVIPVGIWGTQRRYPKSGFRFGRPWRPTVALAFGPPLAPEGDPATPGDPQAFIKDLMGRIEERVASARGIT
jgi:1-acyl-sn-glycerol-3-phosphate acyltransferase